MIEGAQAVYKRLLQISAHTDDPDQALERFGERVGDLLLAIRSRHSDVQARLVDEWGDAFDYYEVLLAACLGTGLAYESEHGERAKRDGDARFLVLAMLLARACLTAGEVLALMRSGFGPGAFGLWHRLHETQVEAKFVAAHDNDLATRFIDFDRFQSSTTLFDYAHFAEQRGWDPYPAADDRTLKSRSRKRRKRYEPFAGRFDWAHDALLLLLPDLRDRSVRLSDLENAVGMAHLRPLYEVATGGAHPDLTRAAAGLAGVADPVLAGPEGSGISMAGAQTAGALYECTAAFLGVYSDRESDRVLAVLDRLAEGTTALFAASESDDDPDEGEEGEAPATELA
jgi:hypothetical protein